jgi:hypothetical protein
MNNLTDNEFESEKERAWQEYLKLAYASKSEYKAFLYGANLAKQENARLTSELSDYRALVDAADFVIGVGFELRLWEGKWQWQARHGMSGLFEGSFDSALDAFKSLQAENKS